MAVQRTDPQRILIIRTDRMGDVVLSTPVLTAIKNTWPLSHTTMMIAPYTHDVISGHPDLDEILIDDAKGEHQGVKGLFKLVRLIRSKRFDTVLVLHPSTRLAILCWLAGIPNRIGTGYRSYSLLFNTRIMQHRKKSGRHELELNLDLAKAIGANVENIDFKFHIPEKAEQRVQMLLEQNKIKDKPYIVIHPGSGGSALDWPIENFAELANRLINTHNMPVVVTGSASESPLAEAIAQKAIGVIRFDGQLNIKELASVLKHAATVTANSTGPLHLAVATGSNVVGLYCTLQACHPNRWGPYNQLDTVITPPEDADYGEGKNPMQLIPVEQVLDMIIKKARL